MSMEAGWGKSRDRQNPSSKGTEDGSVELFKMQAAEICTCLNYNRRLLGKVRCTGYNVESGRTQDATINITLEIIVNSNLTLPYTARIVVDKTTTPRQYSVVVKHTDAIDTSSKDLLRDGFSEDRSSSQLDHTKQYPQITCQSHSITQIPVELAKKLAQLHTSLSEAPLARLFAQEVQQRQYSNQAGKPLEKLFAETVKQKHDLFTVEESDTIASLQVKINQYLQSVHKELHLCLIKQNQNSLYLVCKIPDMPEKLLVLELIHKDSKYIFDYSKKADTKLTNTQAKVYISPPNINNLEIDDEYSFYRHGESCQEIPGFLSEVFAYIKTPDQNPGQT